MLQSVHSNNIEGTRSRGSARLAELPTPPREKRGWPWTEESDPLPNCMSDGQPWPCITVVTPSFNQGEFLEETIRSVLLQGYPSLEYLVMDGGSKDESAAIIEKYSPWLSYWSSGPDGGQSRAINRGLSKGTGLLAAWVNSDDLLCKNALVRHAMEAGFAENVIYAGTCLFVSEAGAFISEHQGRVGSFEDLLRVATVWRTAGNIVQPETLFPRELAVAAGGLNPDNHRSMDFELWGRLLLAGARIEYTGIQFGMFRQHGRQKTQDQWRQTESLVEAAKRLAGLPSQLSDKTRNEILAELDAYWKSYQSSYWKSTGRLAQFGVPPFIANPLRDLRRVFEERLKRQQFFRR